MTSENVDRVPVHGALGSTLGWVALVLLLEPMALATAQAQPGGTTLPNPTEEQVPTFFDSGPLDNPGDQPAVLFERDVQTPDAAWSRAYFSAIELPPGSVVRITSLADGEVQELDSFLAEMWSRASAYFNGDEIRIELVAAPHTSGNRVALQSVGIEKPSPIKCEIGHCEPCIPDNRVPSNQNWVGRWVNGGCTASVINLNGCWVSAGHCYTDQFTVLAFNVPPSAPDCSMQQPPVADQFPVVATWGVVPPCVPDWRVGRIGINSIGQSHHQRYGVFRPVANGPPPVTAPVQLYGYGTSSIPARYGVQQRSTGTVANVCAGAFGLSGAAVTIGTSGGAWLYNNQIVGIMTCCGFNGCFPESCVVSASRIDQPAFVAQRQQGCPHAVHAPWAKPFCLNQQQVTVPITVCNSSGAPDSYTLSFAPVSPGLQCQVNGPTSFTVTPNPVGPIPNGSCDQALLTIGRPGGLNQTGITACFDVIATSVNTNVAVTTRGSVTDRRDLCSLPFGPGGPYDLVVDQPQEIEFSLRNDTVPSGVIPYRFEALGSNGERSGAVALEGNYPGVPSVGVASIPLGSTAQLTVDVRYRWTETYELSDLVLSTDLDGDGTYEPLASEGMRSIAPGPVDVDPTIGSGPAGILSCLPNPTRGATSIALRLNASAPVRLSVFDVAGRLVRKVVEERLGPGEHALVWDGRDQFGREASTGLYFAELVARDLRQTMKIVLLR